MTHSTTNAHGGRVPYDEWTVINQGVPIPTVDLIVVNDRSVLLGKRTNEPAKGMWFVPGGRILKNERRKHAAYRLLEQELGKPISESARTDIVSIEELGIYEHFFDSADVPTETGKHCIATAYVVVVDSRVVESDEQHEELRWFSDVPKNTHEYTLTYVSDVLDSQSP